MDPKDEVLTTDEAAQLLKVSKKTLLRHARDGDVLPKTQSSSSKLKTCDHAVVDGLSDGLPTTTRGRGD